MMSLKGKNERSPRFAAILSTRGGLFRLLLPPPCPPASTAREEGLHGGLLEGSCGRRRRRGIRNRLKVGTYALCACFWIRNAHPRAVWKKLRLYICTITDKILICAVPIIHCLHNTPIETYSTGNKCKYLRLRLLSAFKFTSSTITNRLSAFF